MEKMENLNDILRDTWNQLFRAAVQRKSPLHTPAFATFDGEKVASRIVVIRETDTADRLLTCYTDFRSKKVAALQQHPRASWLFWHPGKKFQIRASGTTTIHCKDDLARGKWEAIPPKNRKDYGAKLAPGSVLQQPTDGLDHLEEEMLTTENTAYTLDNFTVLRTEVTELDWLHLHRDGHRRAIFQWQDGDWKKQWVVP